MRHPLPSLLEVSLVLTLMSAAPAAAADPRFSAPVHATTGLAPSALVTLTSTATPSRIGDTDMDDSSVSVLLGKGDGSFAARLVYRTTRWPWDLAAADPTRTAGRIWSRWRRRPGAPRGVPERRRGSLPSRGLVAPDRRGGRRGRRQRRPRRGLVAATEARRDFAVLLGTGGDGFAPPQRSPATATAPTT